MTIPHAEESQTQDTEWKRYLFEGRYKGIITETECKYAAQLKHDSKIYLRRREGENETPGRVL
jgi:hypothetical protein